MLETATGSGVLPRELLYLLGGGRARGGGRGAASGGGERFAADFFTTFHFGRCGATDCYVLERVDEAAAAAFVVE